MKSSRIIQYSVRLIVFVLVYSCSSNQTMNITQQPFGGVNGQKVFMYTLKHDKIEMQVLNYGGIVTSIKVPDRDGKMEDIVWGFDNMEDYKTNPSYFGALIGRYGNRIAKGQFTLNGQAYTLSKNNDGNTLHGGLKGFDKQIWQAKPFKTEKEVGLELTYTSKDMEEGYPGNLKVKVRYTLSANQTWTITYHATTDKPTVLNLTSHSYFNLAGEGSILDHEIVINADKYLAIDGGLIPTGEATVEGTPMDFRQLTSIGKKIDNDFEALTLGKGYDHCWVLNTKGDINQQATYAYDAKSGRTLTMYTTEPGVQLYTGNFLDGTLTGKGGVRYQKRSAFCFETQHYPDSPNHSEFPTTTLLPGQTYHSVTVHRFSVK